ncbi:MAG: hypothetical protein EXS32_17185 [Opitutus sp.]|nr:hypothetical protein [Opitutus sp.]
MRRPPDCVALVARTHWLVGATALVSFLALYLLVGRLPNVEFSSRTYTLALGIGLSYCLTGVLVWFGAPAGRFMSRVCGLIYLTRPRLGSHLWQIMDSAEFKAHFGGKVPPPPL